MASKSDPKTVPGSGAVRIVHALYYYVIMVLSVITISVTSFILLRRILIDTVFPELRIDDYTFEATRESLRFSYPECEVDSSEYNSDKCDEIVERENNKIQNESDERYARTRAEQYLYSILWLIIAGVVVSVHVGFFRPNSLK